MREWKQGIKEIEHSCSKCGTKFTCNYIECGGNRNAEFCGYCDVCGTYNPVCANHTTVISGVDNSETMETEDR